MGEEGPNVPDDVERVRVHPSVTVIPERAFSYRRKLTEIELCDGLLEIGGHSFSNCVALRQLRIPSTVKIIGLNAFKKLPVSLFHLPDSDITNFRSPPLALITTIPESLFCECECMFSLEIPENVTRIDRWAFYFCHNLRNIAIPHNIDISNDAFMVCTDLRQLFEYSAERIITALKSRFENLRIHKLIYYQSYNNLTVDQLIEATNRRCGQRRSMRSKLDPTGKQKDCLGMTPLNILSCSTIHRIELYKILIEKYPESLIAEDRWGALPLLYAIRGNAPKEIVQLLVESYQSIHPNHTFNWNKMVETMGQADAPNERIQNLISIQQQSFPKQSIHWDRVLEKAVVSPSRQFFCVPSAQSFANLIRSSISSRLNAVGVKQWRDDFNWNGRCSNRY